MAESEKLKFQLRRLRNRGTRTKASAEKDCPDPHPIEPPRIGRVVGRDNFSDSSQRRCQPGTMPLGRRSLRQGFLAVLN
jgi:hypothetical protein